MSTQSDVCGLIRIVCTHLHHHHHHHCHLLEYDELLNRLKCHNNQNGTLIVILCVRGRRTNQTFMATSCGVARERLEHAR